MFVAAMKMTKISRSELTGPASSRTGPTNSQSSWLEKNGFTWVDAIVTEEGKVIDEQGETVNINIKRYSSQFDTQVNSNYFISSEGHVQKTLASQSWPFNY